MKQATLQLPPEDEQWGWKNVEKGTICQNVVKESPAALYKDAGLKVPADPTEPHNGFQAVRVKVTGITKVKVQSRLMDQMTVVEV